MFKKKQEPDGSVQFKLQIVSKGFMQIQGINYMEKFAPIAHDPTKRTIIALTLENKHLGWKCETVNIEAAFLERPINVPTFME